MNNNSTTYPKKYISIGECERCRRIPTKVAIDTMQRPWVIPPEVNALATVVELKDESTPAHCVSITRLMKCEECGTYYYYNHYNDQGQHFMDPTCDEITVRRYTPLAAVGFMEDILMGTENALPRASGQLRKAYAEGIIPPETRISKKDFDGKMDAVRTELEEIRQRYASVVNNLAEVVKRQRRDTNIHGYIIEALCFHYVSLGDWAAMRELLLQHPDPLVRVSTANLMIGIATSDAPVIDLIHTSGAVRTSIEAEINQKGRMEELANILLEAATTTRADTTINTQGYIPASSYEEDYRSAALYGLVVLANRRVRLDHAVPALVELLIEEPILRRNVCWVLRVHAKNKGKPSLILKAISQAGIYDMPSVMADKEVIRLVEVCSGEFPK